MKMEDELHFEHLTFMSYFSYNMLFNCS